jgi:hypothetical protein
MAKAFTRPVCIFFASFQRRITRSYISEFPFWSFIKFQLVFCLSVSGAFAQTKYKIIHIPTPTGSTSSALCLNENGQVVGYRFQGEDPHSGARRKRISTVLRRYGEAFDEQYGLD